MSIEQLKREKKRSLITTGFELLIGALFIALSWQFFTISNAIHTMLSDMAPYAPTYFYDLWKAIQAGFLVGGFIVFVHGAKRIVDNILNAWVKSAVPTNGEQ